MNSFKEDIELSEMVVYLLEGTLSEEKRRQLEQKICSDPSVAQKYIDFILNHAAMIQTKERVSPTEEQFPKTIDFETLEALAEYERTAEEIDIEKPRIEPEKKTEKKTQQKTAAAILTVKKPRRVSLLTAALLSIIATLMVLIALMIPQKQVVATMVDSIGDQWTSSETGLEKGDELFNDRQIKELVSGVVKIRFYQGAEAIIEGPARFSCISNEQLSLESGKVYMMVEQKALGFSVITPQSKIIDLGTEFGIDITADGNNIVQVYKGTASLASGQAGNFKESVVIRKDQAKLMDAKTGIIKDHDFNRYAHIRFIDSTQNFIWRGESLNLADIVGGGNGFGKGTINMGIDPRNGQLINGTGQIRTGNRKYNRVFDNPFIDGVFVPDNSAGTRAVTITSLGHIFEDCPNTNGNFYSEIMNGFINFAGETQISPGGEIFGSLDNPCIFLAANAGITFDLERIRSSLKGVGIRKFTCEAGISQTADKQYADPDIWILLDGKTVYTREKLEFDSTYNIEIEISPEARFLTLIATDGGPLFTESKNDNYNDWCIFGKPYLILEKTR